MKKIEELEKEFDDFIDEWKYQLDGEYYSPNDFITSAQPIKKLMEEIKNEQG